MTSSNLKHVYTNQIGQIEEPPISWTSSDSSVLSVDQTGLAMGITKGQALLICKVETADQPAVSDTAWVVVDDETGMVGQVTERVGALQTTSSYVLEGSFKLRAEGTDLVLELNDDYKASSSLPGLYVYLTNNPNSVSGAFEIGAVTTFSGTHSYDISGIDISEYGYVLYFCKPFGVKVGDGKFQN